ncbi:MAG: hypothetical protein E7584_05760 [Ruminococcaceae bacterium]|nr:hypothetical protein [Oscillospiraceae bacterium]
MAKKKWSFNAFVAGENLQGSNKIYDLDVEMDIRLCANADILLYNPDFPCHDTTDCFVEALKENKHDAVELQGLLPEHIADILPYLKDIKYLSLFKCNRLDDLSFIEELTELRGIYIYWNQKATNLFDARKLPKLTVLSIEDANKLTDFSGLEGSNIENLKIWGCNFLGSFTPKTVVADFEIFTKMPRLKVLNLVPVKNENSRADLLALSKLTALEKFYILEGYFTFEQFAWLKSKLPHTAGIEPLHEWKNWQDETVWSVIGRRKPTVKKSETADEYEAQFYALVAKYKTHVNPPMEGEKD